MLRLGSTGTQVRELQGFLNLLPSALAKLVVDGLFGPRTHGRVLEFQAGNQLQPDGISGPLTMDLLTELLRKLGLLPPAVTAVRPINQQILGMSGTDNLIQQIIPPIMVIAQATFRSGVPTNQPDFTTAAGRVGRLGIFAASDGHSERAVMLLLPSSGAPTRVNICITQGFAQADKDLEPLGWSNPLSPPFVQFALLKHVINRWGAQTLASKKEMAFLYILRAKGAPELGPFANNGAFVRQVLSELVTLTNNAFSFDQVEAFTFSSGISEFNVFSQAIQGHLSLEAVYNIDPNPAITAAAPKGAIRKQFLSGQTFVGAPPPGFEFMPENRWAREAMFSVRSTAFKKPPLFNYLHNHCMPLYAMHLGIQLS